MQFSIERPAGRAHSWNANAYHFIKQKMGGSTTLAFQVKKVLHSHKKKLPSVHLKKQGDRNIILKFETNFSINNILEV